MLRSMLLLAVLAVTSSAGELVVTTGVAREAKLVAIDKRGATLTTDKGEQRCAWRELVRWGSPIAPPPRPRVVLHDGSQLVAAPPWSRDGSVRVDGGKLTTQSVTLGKVELPLASAAQLLCEAARDPGLDATPDREKAPSGEDLVTLVDGDVLRGKLTSMRRGDAEIAIGGELVSIEQGRIASVRIGQVPRQPPSGARLAIGLKDGTLLYATEVEANAGRLSVSLASGGAEVTLRKLVDVRFLQTLASEAVYLSDLTPLDYRHTPYTSVAWPYARDTNLDGGPLQVDGRRYLKGVAMHSPSRVVYRLEPGEFERLDFAMAIDDHAGDALSGGSVVYRVLVARDGGFQSAFTSPVVRSDDPPRTASVDIADARAIALVIEPADFGDRQDHADWLDARLIRVE